MLRITLDVSPLGHALRALEQHFDDSMAEAIELAGEMVVSEARNSHGYTDRTGELTRSIHAEVTDGSFFTRDLGVNIVADAPYAKFVEDGTKAHEIVPRRRRRGGRQALRWIGKDGRAVFRRRVQHPGTRPYLFLKGALDRVFPRIEAVHADGLRKAFKRAGFEVA